jgi:hypothetical protein
MLSLLKNRLYRFHAWCDENELWKFAIMISFVGVPNLMIMMSDKVSVGLLFAGVILFMITCILALTRMNYISGKWIFDGSKYKIPEIGDVIVIERDFLWDGGFRKIKANKTIRPSSNTIEKGEEWRVSNIKSQSCDWKIYLNSERGAIIISYFKSKGHWKTKSDIRNSKLRKIGI